jgi:fluoride ion exporter CrcB/FEX
LEAKPQIFGREEGAAGEALLHLGGLGALWRLYEENGKFAEVFDLSTFVLNFLAIFFTAFFAAFFTTLLDFLVFLAILVRSSNCGCSIVDPRCCATS